MKLDLERIREEVRLNVQALREGLPGLLLLALVLALAFLLKAD